MYNITKDLVIFGADWCNECKSVKKLLDEKGQGYTYIDVDSPAGLELAKQEAIRNLPYGLYNGKFVIRNVATAKEFLLRNGSQDEELLAEKEAQRAKMREILDRVEADRAELDNQAQKRQEGIQVILDEIEPPRAARGAWARAMPLPVENNPLFANNQQDREADF